MGQKHLSSVELFTGAGGLALGVARAGFSHRLLVEYNQDACRTLSRNIKHFATSPSAVELHEGDVRQLDFRHLEGRVDLLAAGAPCQPFSIAGKHRAHADDRNLFPEVFRAQRELRPRAVMIENVRGLLRESLAPFVRFIELQLAQPFVLPTNPGDPESWRSHLSTLERTKRKAGGSADFYRVKTYLLQAADHGVRQKRQRVFFIAIRSDLNREPTSPPPTHSEEALVLEQWLTKRYWIRHGLEEPRSIPHRLRRQVERLSDVDPQLLGHPWGTVRDAIAGLPNPYRGQNGTREIPNHTYQPGARAYPGHTGSPLDEPAKTLKAGVHGVPGGENMLRHPNGQVRYFTVREAARLQGFDDDYVFQGAWSETMRQIGNAVPVELARAVADSIRKTLSSQIVDTEARVPA